MINKVIDKEDILFMKQYINYRLVLLDTGNVSQTEKRVMEIFANILKELESDDYDE